jgi:hypothetical protein
LTVADLRPEPHPANARLNTSATPIRPAHPTTCLLFPDRPALPETRISFFIISRFSNVDSGAMTGSALRGALQGRQKI